MEDSLGWDPDDGDRGKPMTALSQPLADALSKRPTLVDDAYQALKTAIRDNVFPAGYQGSEQEIANQLSMSRTPVHEAIIRLQEEGLVRVLAKRGVVVTSIAPEDMREIYDVIIALEAMAAELLASMKPSERSLIATTSTGRRRQWKRR